VAERRHVLSLCEMMFASSNERSRDPRKRSRRSSSVIERAEIRAQPVSTASVFFAMGLAVVLVCSGRNDTVRQVAQLLHECL
jgi:hypothetical protein